MVRRRSRGGNDAQGCAILLMGIVLLFAIAWPYLLGTWVATALFGVAQHSTKWDVVGWCFETPWLGFLLAVVVLAMRDRQHGGKAAQPSPRASGLFLVGVVLATVIVPSLVAQHDRDAAQLAATVTPAVVEPAVTAPSPTTDPEDAATVVPADSGTSAASGSDSSLPDVNIPNPNLPGHGPTLRHPLGSFGHLGHIGGGHHHW